MRRHEIRVLLFDMGGVLCRLNDPIETFGLEISHDEFLREWILSEAVREFERGAIDAKTFARNIVIEANLPYNADEFLQRFDSWPDRLYPGTIELLESIPQQFVKAVLSNTNAMHWNRAEIGGLLEKSIENIFLSCHTGMLKPDTQAYAHVVEALGCKPQEVLFFDDNPINIDAADQFGYQSVLIGESADLNKALVAHGIIPPG